MLVLRVLAGLAGLAVVVLTLSSALVTVVLPRGVPTRLTRGTFLVVRRVFELRGGHGASFEQRDHVFAAYAQVSLLLLLQVWLVLVYLGFVGLYYAVLGDGLRKILYLSGSALLTLGFDPPPGLPAHLVAFSEAAIGLSLLALLITYLPSLYTSFQRREALVTKLEVRAGRPPSGVTLLGRFEELERPERLEQVWQDWEDWFVDVEESHTSYAPLVFFRSPQPDHSWVTSAGAVLDGAALRASCVDRERSVDAELCIRAGYLSLRRIGEYYSLPYLPDPAPGDPTTISRAEFDTALADLAAAGVPLLPDRDRCWLDFAGWRVNYDLSLVALATLTLAPYAPWSSDRSLAGVRPPALFRRQRTRVARNHVRDQRAERG